MAPSRNDRAAPTAPPGGYVVRFVSNDAAKGWEDLAQQVPSNLWEAWEILVRTPTKSADAKRHGRLRGSLAKIRHKDRVFDQWQLDVSKSGRVWYFVDEEKATVWLTYASTKHPKDTE